jgi:hypothetical protein
VIQLNIDQLNVLVHLKQKSAEKTGFLRDFSLPTTSSNRLIHK